MPFRAYDTAILRELAGRVAEIASLPIQQERAKMWRRHNDLHDGRPMVLIFPEGSWREMLPDGELRCEDAFARDLERDLRRRTYYHDHMQDDNPIEATIGCPTVTQSSGWGVEIQSTRSADPTGAMHFEPVIRQEADIEKIQLPAVTVDWDATRRRMAEMQEVFDGRLAVERRMPGCNHMASLDLFARLRGIDQLFLDLSDRPQWVHQVQQRFLDGQLSALDSLERQGALTLNNRNHYCGSGGNGYTAELPAAGFDVEHVRPRDLWGFATTQIFSEVSPAMHEEFALQYERPFLARFGLAAYGCCEPLHNKLPDVLKIANLRRISISPWADVAKSADRLGDRYIYSYKPNPAAIAAERWNPDAARAGLRHFLQRTRGCVVEMIMKDTHTCRHEPQRMWQWTQIAREVAEDFA